MAGTLSLDFETRSVVDLGACGQYVYADHASTMALCLAYAFDDEPVGIWRPFEGDIFPERIIAHISDRRPVRAWNAIFERVIWNGPLKRQLALELDLPELRIDQTYCTMTEALAMALPGKLEKCAPALKLETVKDTKGHGVMMQLSKPRKARKHEDPDAVHWWTREEAPEKWERIYAYCKQDVETERAIKGRIRSLSKSEQELYWYDQEINDRGIYVDLEATTKLRRIAQEAEERMNAQLPILTGGHVTGNKQHVKFREWVNAQGVDTPSLDKSHVIALLERDDIPDKVREALKIRQMANKSSVAKLDAYLNRRQDDGYMRGNYQFCGAGSTKRWAARGAQLQNIPRGQHKDPDKVIDDLCGFEPALAVEMTELTYGSPVDVITGCLRGMLRASPGNILIDFDFANIEGRMLAWLAGELWKLDAFRDYDTVIGRDDRGKAIRKGPDLYCLAYARSFGIDVDDVTDKQRQVGKVQELALGFQGSIGAFHSMAKNYGVFLPDDEVKIIVDAWREAHPATADEKTGFWRRLEKAAFKAIRNPGTVVSVGVCHFMMKGPHMWLRLPSGGVLCYPFAQIKSWMMPWGKKRPAVTYMREDPVSKQWVRVAAYGGLYAENVTQAASRDVLAFAMQNLRDVHLPIVLHTHDECAIEVPEDGLEEGVMADMRAQMSIVPPWAAERHGGLPIAVEGWMGHRYRKD